MNKKTITKTSPRRKILVGILMGSDSDRPIMEQAAGLLKDFGVAYEMRIASAHRSPHKVLKYAQEAEGRGIQVLIAGAGGAAHLAGVLAAHTLLPVIGVPISSSPWGGLDAMLSTLQMPSGVPVATMAVGAAGAQNAALLALQILALNDENLVRRLRKFKERMVREVESKDQALQRTRKQRAVSSRQ